LLALRNLGAIKKNRFTLIGKNSRLDTIQSIVLKNKIKNVLKWNDVRRKISNIYDKNLEDINEVKLTKTFPGSSRHLYVIRVKNRKKLVKYLTKKNIAVQFHYPYSLNKTGALKNKIINMKLPISEQWAKECISLPLHPKLKISDADYITKQIRIFFKNE